MRSLLQGRGGITRCGHLSPVAGLAGGFRS